MKPKLGILIGLLAWGAARAQTNDLTALLQQGLFEEQASRNLNAAITDYQALAAKFDQDRQLAATAVFRLGECYRAQGRTNEAAAQYQRILHDFSDQPTLATLSQQNLAGMGAGATGFAPAITEKAAPNNADVALWNKLKDKSKAELETLLPTLLPDAALDDLLAKRNDAQTRRALLAVDYATNTPAVARVDAQLTEWNRQIGEKISGMMQALQWRAELAALDAPKDELLDLAVPADSEEDREIQRLQQMIQNSPDLINVPGGDGLTPLVGAAGHGWLKVAAYLLDHGAGVNTACSQGPNSGSITPLVAAVNAGNIAMLKFLMDRGADINFNGPVGNTVLHLAAQKGFPAVAEVLLAAHADLEARNYSNITPLFSAVQCGQTKIVQMLLAAGADPNTRDSNGRTPLGCAADNKNLPVVQLLLAAKADPNVEDSDGRTPLSHAAERGDPQIVQQLLAARADPNAGKLDAPLLVAICNKNPAIAEMLLSAGANANALGSADLSRLNGSFFSNLRQHVTPLWLATYLDQPPLVQLLLKYHADPNNAEIDGQSLLFTALRDTNLLAALLDAHAMVDPVSKDETGWTPLGAAAAAEKNNAAVVEILLQHGADPNVRNSNGVTPLHWAEYRLADRHVFELLLANHADPNVRSSNGRTPLAELKVRLADKNAPSEQKAAAAQLADLLRQHGALDKLPDWDSISVSRPADNSSFPMFRQGTNNWNQFTLLDAIFDLYASPTLPPFPQRNGMTPFYPANSTLPFPDLTRVVIVRPSHDSTNETRRMINLLNRTNGLDCAQDVALEFGDTVEVPEREHSLGEAPVGLTTTQTSTLIDYVKGRAQLVAHGQKVEIPFYRYGNGPTIATLLAQPAAEDLLFSSSDLTHVKVIRHDPKTGKTREWILDCSLSPSFPNQYPRPGFGTPVLGMPGPIIGRPRFGMGNENKIPSLNDLLLRDGDVIEVPDKPDSRGAFGSSPSGGAQGNANGGNQRKGDQNLSPEEQVILLEAQRLKNLQENSGSSNP